MARTKRPNYPTNENPSLWLSAVPVESITAAHIADTPPRVSAEPADINIRNENDRTATTNSHHLAESPSTVATLSVTVSDLLEPTAAPPTSAVQANGSTERLPTTTTRRGAQMSRIHPRSDCCYNLRSKRQRLSLNVSQENQVEASEVIHGKVVETIDGEAAPVIDPASADVQDEEDRETRDAGTPTVPENAEPKFVFKEYRPVFFWKYKTQEPICVVRMEDLDNFCSGCESQRKEIPLSDLYFKTVWGKCIHAFHEHCIQKWFEECSSRTCSLDRQVFEVDRSALVAKCCR